MRAFFLVLSVFTFFGSSLTAQPGHDHQLPSHFEDPGHLNCGHTEVTKAFYEAHPEEAVKAAQAAQEFAVYKDVYNNSGQPRSATRIISVVFHIVHENGIENISNEQVLSAIEVLNQDCSATNAELGTVQPAFAGIVGNLDIEFRLARKDPEDNCTNGIVRVVNSATNNGEIDNLTAASPLWPRNRYLNIYVAGDLANGAAGFTLKPVSVSGGFGASIDAIYMQHNYVGDNGTGNPATSHALTHEVGHWLGLDHTWGQGNAPGDPSNCNIDDGIADTPNTVGWETCNVNGSSCGTLDNVENFMEYSYCHKMFTQGQVNLMHATLTSTVAQRNQIHSIPALNSTGVLEPEIICLADFQVNSRTSGCSGMEVDFSDVSFNGVTTRSWSFPGGSPSTSSQPNPTILYFEPGVYPVTLTVSNGQGSQTVTKESLIVVQTLGQENLPFNESFESFSGLHLTNNWQVTNPDGDELRQWSLFEGAGYSGNKSIFVQNRFNTNGAVEVIESPTFDLSGVSDLAVVTFKYAHARRSNSSDDKLRVWISRNCGTNWVLRNNIEMADLPTVNNFVNVPFVPNNQSQWKEVTISGVISVFLNDEFRIRFEFIGNNGNNIYIDDINIFDPNEPLNADNLFLVQKLKLYPNPGADFTTIEYAMTQSSMVTAELLDISGRVVEGIFSAQRAAGKYLFQFNLNHLASGIYFVRIGTDEGSAVQKLMVR